MKFPVFFLLLAINGYVSAQLIPGVLCGVAGIACPTSTTASGIVTTAGSLTTTTTPEEIETICIDIPGSNIDLTINPAEITQGQLDQVQQLLEDLVSNLQSPDGLLGDFLDGLNGILNPGTTQAPGGNGQLCLVLPTSQVDELENFLNGTLNAFSACVQEVIDNSVNALQTLLDNTLNELNEERQKCGLNPVCLALVTPKYAAFAVEFPIVLVEKFLKSVKDITSCLPPPVNP
ncbi:unnamed protein product [Caenorhabditis brenneri]